MPDDFEEGRFEYFVVFIQLVEQDGVNEKVTYGVNQRSREIALRKSKDEAHVLADE